MEKHPHPHPHPSGFSSVSPPPKSHAAAALGSLPPSSYLLQARGWSSQVGVRRALYSSRAQRGKGLKRKSRMKGKRGKKRIRRLGRAETCNVKHHRCQLGNLGPGLAPIHKSRRLQRRAGPMWIESEVAAGPRDAGGGWPDWVTASKAERPGRLGPAGAALDARARSGMGGG